MQYTKEQIENIKEIICNSRHVEFIDKISEKQNTYLKDTMRDLLRDLDKLVI